ncbi:MAG: hypothetical protein RIA64_17710 [Rhodospirillales bacterium]
MSPSDTDDVTAVLDWLKQFQGFQPEGVELADPAGAARAAAKAGREAALGLPFDADPTGFTLLLDSLARKDP